MNNVVTRGIILTRINYQEADRILTILTPDHGKVRVIAKGVRRERSKLAGGIELFSVSHISFIPGRKDISTLVSTRLIHHYAHIVQDINRTMLGYDLLKMLNRTTEDAAGSEYFELMETTLAALDNLAIDSELIKAWFQAHLLKLAGHQPNLRTDTTGATLRTKGTYMFDVANGTFIRRDKGVYHANEIKCLRLLFGAGSPQVLAAVKDLSTVLTKCRQIITAMYSEFMRI